MKTKRNRKSTIPAIALKGEKALKAAVAEVVAEHKRTGTPLAVWHNGKAVLMNPDEAVKAVREDRAVYKMTRRKQTSA
jgi:hypothetical protein